ncbi:RNA pseudouridylate synthase domain-containing protein 1 isoform X2 [Pteropus alecto]|uniref:RNA pseudouridylate synthase domain-containing protein 1 isoform X2 n=1 Tax=Pteropus alecto TaxID=9402 RepID=UPI000D536CB0|nr:RNA pseudouridylate synthase domain-containing protein 1 isoform X2 [Pteropus alecto]XP_039740771.1 RNA pseudouridylate synthase domain-containing protein 1 isoform X3 [Pteropus giganteus]
MEPGSMENLSIVYRSRDFLVVNKHWDVRIDSKTWRETLTLQKQLRHRFPELADPDTYYGFRFCHQLDFSTSGALCVALNKAAAGSAYKCFKERRVTKAYLALAVRTRNQASRSSSSWNMGCMQVTPCPKCCCSPSQAGRTSFACTAVPLVTPLWAT